jgi:hypothetical protein
MLDAMRMEELDVRTSVSLTLCTIHELFQIIKVRQPLPKRKRRRTERDSELSATPNDASEETPTELSEAEKLESFVDMLFGGKLASILVCDTCKKVSVTYEDFNDLSLSIKPEDYVKERKRDRLRHFAKKLRFRPKGIESRGSSPHRSSSVPASPARRSMDPQPHEEPPINVDHRRRSFDHVSGAGETEEQQEAKNAVRNLAATAAEETQASALLPSAVEDEDLEPERIEKTTTHVAFSEGLQSRPKGEGELKKEKEDAWGKLGRRISMSMGMAKKDKRSSRSRDRSWKGLNAKDSDLSRGSSPERRPPLPASRPPMPSRTNSQADIAAEVSDVVKPRSANPSPATSPLSTPPLNISRPLPNIRRHSAMSLANKRSKPAPIPKPSRGENAYLRALLADVHPATPSAFSALHHAISGGSQSSSGPASPSMSAQTLLAKLGHMPGIEEALRLFTAVEILDGDNMVGCHRCWKIANGKCKPRPGEDNEKDESEGSEEDNPVIERPQMIRLETHDSAVDLPGRISPASTSLISGSAASSSLFLHETASISSAPTTIQTVLPNPIPMPNATAAAAAVSPPRTPDPPSSYGGLPIPSISTTEPDTPTPSSNPKGPSPIASPSGSPTLSSLVPPKLRKHRSSSKQMRAQDESSSSSDDGYDSSDVSDIDSAYSEASSIASASASPSASRRASLENVNKLSEASEKRDGNASTTEPKIPRSQQVVMRKTYKRYLIATPPPILVVHLKRFQQVSKTNPYAMAFSSGLKKLDDFVAFPEYLDIAPFLAPKKDDFGLGPNKSGHHHSHHYHRQRQKDERCVYRLYAVVVHIGNMVRYRPMLHFFLLTFGA